MDMTNSCRTRLPWVVALLMAATCRRSAPTRCPSEAVIAEIHASAFYYQTGAMNAGEQSRRMARSLTSGALPDSTTSKLLQRLDEIAGLSSSAVDERARLAEHLRLTLSEWSCLSPGLHESLHRELPDIPGASTDHPSAL